MEEKEKQISMDIADALIERPQGFSIGDKRFALYPITLGKMYLLQRLVDGLEVNMPLLNINPFAEAIRLVKTKREDCCRLVAYHTLRTKKEVFDNNLVDERTQFLNDIVDEDSLAEIVYVVLSSDKTITFMEHLGITDESKRYAKAMQAKKDSSTLTFGGKSVYGNLIDVACERYGWTLDYVVWGVSYTNLQLLLADSIKTVYLSEEERKKSRLSNEPKISGDDPANNERIMSMNWD